MKPRMHDIASRVAADYGLKLSDLIGPATHREVSRPRHVAMAEIYATGLFSLPQIGRFFGGRDHSSVRYGVLRVAERQAA